MLPFSCDIAGVKGHDGPDRSCCQTVDTSSPVAVSLLERCLSQREAEQQVGTLNGSQRWTAVTPPPVTSPVGKQLRIDTTGLVTT